jgi:hypothetical protein
MKNPLENGGRVRTPKKNKNSNRMGGDKGKIKTPKKGKKNIPDKKRNRRRTEKKIRRKKENRIYIKGGASSTPQPPREPTAPGLQPTDPGLSSRLKSGRRKMLFEMSKKLKEDISNDIIEAYNSFGLGDEDGKNIVDVLMYKLLVGELSEEGGDVVSIQEGGSQIYYFHYYPDFMNSANIRSIFKNISGKDNIGLGTYIPVFIKNQTEQTLFIQDLMKINNEEENIEIYKLSPQFIKEFFTFALKEKDSDETEYNDKRLTELKLLVGYRGEDFKDEEEKKRNKERKDLVEQQAVENKNAKKKQEEAKAALEAEIRDKELASEKQRGKEEIDALKAQMEAMLVEQRRLEEALKRNGEDAKLIQGRAGEIEQAEIEREEKITIEEQKREEEAAEQEKERRLLAQGYAAAAEERKKIAADDKIRRASEIKAQEIRRKAQIKGDEGEVEKKKEVRAAKIQEEEQRKINLTINLYVEGLGGLVGKDKLNIDPYGKLSRFNKGVDNFINRISQSDNSNVSTNQGGGGEGNTRGSSAEDSETDKAKYQIEKYIFEPFIRLTNVLMSSETIQNLNGINIDKLRALHMAYLSPKNVSDTNYRYENAIQKILSFLFIVPNVVFRSEEQIKNEGLVTGVQAAVRGQQARKDYQEKRRLITSVQAKARGNQARNRLARNSSEEIPEGSDFVDDFETALSEEQSGGNVNNEVTLEMFIDYLNMVCEYGTIEDQINYKKDISIINELSKPDKKYRNKSLITDEINKLGENKLGIHIYNFSSIIQKFLELTDEIGMAAEMESDSFGNLPYDNIKDESRMAQNIEESIYRHFSTLLIEKYLNIIPENETEVTGKKTDMTNIIGDALNIRGIPANSSFHTIIKQGVKESASNKILTYVKIRNDHQTLNNQRFEIKLLSDREIQTGKMFYNEMMIKYRDTKDKIHEVGASREDIQPVENVEKGIKVEEKNSYNYLFGKYTRIFPQRIGPLVIKNDYIAKNMNSVVRTLDEGKPVFIIGYGASGAGKTSTLIYFKSADMEEGENGILIELCKEMQKYGYEKANVKTKEYYQSKYPPNLEYQTDTPGGRGKIDVCKEHNTEKGVTVCETSKEITFNWVKKIDKNNPNAGDFKIVDKKSYKDVIHEYRSTPQEIQNQRTNGTTLENMGEVIVNLVDKDRLVKATTNNPQSSRSHTVVYIELIKNDGKKAYLFVGDFAGVENAFPCPDLNTIRKFVDIEFPAKQAIIPQQNHPLGKKLEAERRVPFYSYGQKAGGLQDNPSGKCNSLEDCPLVKVDPVYGTVPPSNDYIWDPNIKNIGTIQLMNFDWLAGKVLAEGVPGTMDKLYVKGWLDYLINVNGPKYCHGLSDTEKRIAMTQLNDEDKFNSIPLENIMELMLYGVDGLKVDKLNVLKGNDKVYEDIWKRMERNDVIKNNYDKIQVVLESGNIETEGPLIADKVKEGLSNFYDSVKWINENMGGNKWHDWIGSMGWMPYLDRNTRFQDQFSSYSTEYYGSSSGKGGEGQSKKSEIADAKNWHGNEWQSKRGKRTQDTFWQTPATSVVGTGSIQLGLKKGEKAPTELNNRRNGYKGARQKLLDLLHSKEYDSQTNQGGIIADFFDIELKDLLKDITSTKIISDEKDILPIVKQVLREYDEDKNIAERVANKKGDIMFNYVDMTNAKGKTELFKYLLFGRYTLTTRNTALELLRSSGVVKQVTRGEILAFRAEDNPDKPLYMKKLKIEDDSSNRDSTLTVVKVCEEIINSTVNRLNYGKAICANRLIEGKFINNSLYKIRKTLEKILISKNQDVIFTIPNNSSLCSDYYKEICGETCFNSDGGSKVSPDERSIIIYDIYEYLKDGRKTGKSGGVYEEEDFHKELLVSVCLVLNMSPLANNPPPAPHINLTGIKIAIAKYLRGQMKEENVRKEIEKINSMIDYYNEGKNNVGDNTNRVDINKLNWRRETGTIDEVKEWVTSIDNTNAVSAIGTMEFLDEISKFYTTKIICQVSDNIFDNAQNYHGYTPYLEIIKNQRFDQKKDLTKARKNKQYNSELKVIDYKGSESYTGGRVVEYDRPPKRQPTVAVAAGGGLLIRNRKKRTMKKRNV